MGLRQWQWSELCVVSSIELFQKMCEELRDWIGEKVNGINLDDVGKDLASVKVLQRKQQNLEQELKPIEEKMNKMNMMANAYVHFLLITQPPMRRMRICFTDVFFVFFSVRHKIPDNRSRERLNGFS